jgi:hypothetical protein
MNPNPPSSRLRGRVVKGAFGTGSKSERDAVYLETPDQRLLLRRPGGNSFSDPELEKLVGKEVEISGRVVGGYTLMIDAHEEL